MGVDAVMGFSCWRDLSESEVLDLSVDLCEAFGAAHFWMTRPSEANEWRKPRHAIHRSDSEWRVCGDYTVSLSGRYYGEGYERGDLMLYINVAEWLERRLPGCTVYYGGDSGDVARPFDRIRRGELFDHFAAYGHKPYRGAFDRAEIMPRTDGIERPSCDLCLRPLIQHGFGPRYAAFVCHGCGYSTETRDGGETWAKPERALG